MEFHPSYFFVKNRISGKILHKGPSKNGLYQWSPSPSVAPPSVFSSERASHQDWHARLGHLADRILHQVVSKFHLPITSNKKLSLCSACRRGKSHQLPFSLSDHPSHFPLELVFSDVWKPSPILSNNGARYYVIFVDHYSKFSWLYPTKCKSDVFTIFPKFQAYVEHLFDRKIKSIQTDGGGEFQKLCHLFTSHGIHHQLTCPHTREQNGSVERKHHHIVEMGFTLLAHASAPSPIGLRPSKQPPTLSIDCPLRSSTIYLPFKSSLTFAQTTLSYKFLDVHAGPIYGHTTDTNWIIDLQNAFSLAIVPLIVATNVSISILVMFIYLVMSSLMNLSSPFLDHLLPL
jgi:hypothetical protein